MNGMSEEKLTANIGEQTVVLTRMRAEDDATCAVHELSLVAELLGNIGNSELTLSAESADGLDSILTRAAMRTRALLDVLKDERMASIANTRE